ncbi:C5a anaphylatoxin chemotactic receptor 1-like [Clytia hemisphaerica]|uniref:G-protein coupled receptors family 1 profile domain-containing protein n=1 Tax=Clytia hemisphaerica TaxID=252671 RepID=A0A7M5VA73_9CNID
MTGGTSSVSSALNLTNLKEGGHAYPTHNIQSLDNRDVLLISCFAVIFLIGVAGNLLVCYVFLRRQTNSLSTMELLIVFLAVADLIASIFNPLVFIYWTVTFHKAWHFGWIGCKILPSLTRITVTVSFGIILIITVDRCVVICFPFRRNMKRNEVYISVAGALLFAILSELSYTIYIEVNPLSTCQVPDSRIPGFVYPHLAFLVLRDVAFLPIFTVTVNLIHKHLYNKEVISTLREQRVVKKTRKIMQMLIIMAFVFVVLVYPRDILHVTFNISWLNAPGIPYTKAIIDVNSSLKVLHMCNSVCNVFIYARLHGKFRRRVFKLIKQLLRLDSDRNKRERGRALTNDDDDVTIDYDRTLMTYTYIRQSQLCQELFFTKEGHKEHLYRRKFSITRMSRERQSRYWKQVALNAEQRLMFSKETIL